MSAEAVPNAEQLDAARFCVTLDDATLIDECQHIAARNPELSALERALLVECAARVDGRRT